MDHNATQDEFRGRCLCGAVAYAFSGAPLITVACHCSLCRKLTGSAFGTWTLVPLERFHFTAGSEHVREYQSSHEGRRQFCAQCGSTLASLTSKRPGLMHVAAGTLDEAPDMRIALHAYVGSKAPWYVISDDAPQHAEEPKRVTPVTA